MSIWRGGRTKSESETTRLDFDPADLRGFNAHVENLRLDRAHNSSSRQPKFQDATITIDVPSGSKEIAPQTFSIPGLQYRSIISKLHFTPFKLFRILPGADTPERLYSELYNSDAFIHEHDHCQLERVVLGLMFCLWPIYMIPNSGACQHIAYIPSVSPRSCASILAYLHFWSTTKQREGLLTHCRRELMHAVWRFLLDDEFLDAWKYGIVIRCHDGVSHRFYPRIFTYSADYPEKVLLATIRDKGKCPCPRCLVEKLHLDRMGLFQDLRTRTTRLRQLLTDAVRKARDFIYRLGVPINGTAVDNLLKATSSIPTVVMSKMLVVDLLHEIELGVWRTLFIHLIRMLYATPSCGPDLVALLDRRFRQVPAFGTTIRRFSGNPSEMKKLAARDFEDLLQHNNRLAKLLYRLAEWHALAKLHLHSETTLGWLETITKEVGVLMRAFRDKTASKFDTFELPREQEARTRRQAGNQFHAMGDYVPSIRLFATTDNYSTQAGELAHRIVKALYGLTNKRNASKQIAKRYNREKRLQQAKASLRKAKKLEQAGESEASTAQIRERHLHHVGMELSTVEEDMKIPADVHHFISENTNHPIPLHTFLVNENRNDPAKKKFYAVKTMRINYTTYDVRRDQDVINPRTDHRTVMVQSADNDSRKHPYWYAQVLGIFHADVVWLNNGQLQEIEHMEFLWVRWMGAEPRYRWGRKAARLPKIGFVPESDPYAFGFLDPALVIRACHLIPDFVTGRTSELLSTQQCTAARAVGETDDWGSFYVNIFVDRDMFMWHAGGGVGHARFVAADDSSSDDALDNEEEGGESVPPAGNPDSDDDDASDFNDDNLDEDEHEDKSDDELGPDDGEDLYEDDGYGTP
ncbi:hypothetical protein EV360DRAFT_97728 [Lentinula raphanica]|nr:hypothetical protein EV360DRAFT_97728 [Lentinula raphanica]